MQKYESQQHQIRRPTSEIFDRISRLDALSPMLADKVEGWTADADSCSFKVKGFTAALRITERDAPKLIKIQPDAQSGLPVDFTFWIQLAPVAENDTRLRLVLHAHLNMMMKMMIGSKLQEAIDKAADVFAKALA